MDSSSWDTNSDDAADFVVHHFSLLGSRPATVLDDASSIIHAATTRAEWSNVGLTSSFNRPFLATNSEKDCFQYRSLTIHVGAEGINDTRRVYKEWGAPISNDEIFRLDDLDDFVSSDLTFLLEIPLAQKPELILDVNPLHSVIPQPHIHPSPFIPTPARKPNKMTPYSKTVPTPIPPHTLPLPPASPYARSAWLIPIRGAFPWAGCTSAVMLDPSVAAANKPIPTPDALSIAWTHASLDAFWTFLLGVRDAHMLGPIGVSFHAAARAGRHTSQASASASTSVTANYTPGAGGQLVSVSASSSSSGERSHATFDAVPPTMVVVRAALADVDYVKVYHEAACAMYLRNVLHLWSYVVEEDSQGNVDRKIRLLKGAKLVLVDERARGVLVS